MKEMSLRKNVDWMTGAMTKHTGTHLRQTTRGVPTTFAHARCCKAVDEQAVLRRSVWHAETCTSTHGSVMDPSTFHTEIDEPGVGESKENRAPACRKGQQGTRCGAEDLPCPSKNPVEWRQGHTRAGTPHGAPMPAAGSCGEAGGRAEDMQAGSADGRCGQAGGDARGSEGGSEDGSCGEAGGALVDTKEGSERLGGGNGSRTAEAEERRFAAGRQPAVRLNFPNGRVPNGISQDELASRGNTAATANGRPSVTQLLQEMVSEHPKTRLRALREVKVSLHISPSNGTHGPDKEQWRRLPNEPCPWWLLGVCTLPRRGCHNRRFLFTLY
jgi:hypothetical protein